MGSIVSIVTLPATLLIDGISRLNKQIDGRWKTFLTIVWSFWWKRLRRGRLEFHDPDAKNDAVASGLVPNDSEWTFESPSKDKSESVYFFGVNSEGSFLTLNIKRILLNSRGEFESEVVFRLKDVNGNVYNLNEKCKQALDLNKPNEYKIGGLAVEVISPFRRLRIKFRGYLKNSSNELIFAKIRLLWLVTSSAFDFQRNHDDVFLAQELTANNNGETEVVFENRFEQFGQIKGIIQVEDHPEQEIFLWGSKSKTFMSNIRDDQVKVTRLFGYAKNGMAFQVGLLQSIRRNIKYKFGFGFWRLGIIYPMVDTSLNNEDFGSVLKNSCQFSMKCGTQQFKIEIGKNETENPRNIKINGNPGQCFVVEDEHEFCRDIFLDVKKQKKIKQLVLSFDEDGADEVGISGGKGSSLAKLRSLSDRFESSPKFQVPKGIIVTTNAYKMLMKDEKLLKPVDSLQKFVWSAKKTDSQYKSKCQDVSNAFVSHKLPSDIREEITKKMKTIFSDFENKLFAVRSSASGEDSEEMSAAGQMTTLLGVKGSEQIFEAVMKCWASQFSFVAVEYKRGYGQMINTPMAVVIQEMVDCEAAGVLFTCDPVSGDERNILITSNFGLGETVVSAASEPDTVVLGVQVNDNTLECKRKVTGIIDKKIGSKKKIMKLLSNGGTVEEEVDDGTRLSISEEMAIKLGEVALEAHKFFGNARDIEWGIKNKAIYLLQSRPVTNLDAYSDYELMHELDSGMNSEREISSRAHWGENFPGAMSWTCLTYMMKTWDLMMKKMKMTGQKYSPYDMQLDNFIFNQKFFSFSGGFIEIFSEYPESKFAHSMVVSFFGHEIDDEDVLNAFKLKRADLRTNPLSWPNKLMKAWFFLNMLFFPFLRLRMRMRKMMPTYDLIKNRHFKDSNELFQYIINKHDEMLIGQERHGGTSFFSMLFNFILFSLLEKAGNRSDADADFTNLLSSCNEVVSAEVPNQLKNIAKSIEDVEEFLQMSDEEAIELLCSGVNEASDKFKNFIAKHGHRGYKEFDPAYPPFGENPKPVVKMIKMILRGGREALMKKKPKSNDEIIDQLKTKLSSFQKLLLKYVYLPLARNAVGGRENSKYFMIWMYNKFGECFRLLAKKMVAEGKIPDEETFFYLTLEDIQRLMQVRDPLVLAKARHRKRLHPKMDKHKFPEFVKGAKFVPRNTEPSPLISSDAVKMRGTSVSIGKVTARACVAEDLEDAVNIQPGDVLITYSTDIGWSPYFPLLSGIVTEIGGVVSHGAVIAREFGIPCLIAVEGACNVFKTGDRVLLDTDKAEIVKVETP